MKPTSQPDISSCELEFHLPHSNLTGHPVYHDTQLPDDQSDHRQNTFPAAQAE